MLVPRIDVVIHAPFLSLKNLTISNSKMQTWLDLFSLMERGPYNFPALNIFSVQSI
jgi:hypothetical protein